MLPWVTFKSTHNQLLYFAMFFAGSTPKIANKNIQQRTLPGFVTIPPINDTILISPTNTFHAVADAVTNYLG